MKKISLIAFAIICITLISCKKDRVCECTITDSSGTSTANVTYFDARKSDARLWCTSNSYQYENLTPTASSGSKTVCKLK
ncbi:MAG: hypothetical protein ACK5AY_07325 [Bacteroidota bacterium]|jgi:hypothetical protein